jgi:hypothetical protein
MEILKFNNNQNLVINGEVNFKTDAGWQENLIDLENETLKTIINPIENYETIRYIHKPYSGITSDTGDTQTDIWFYFYFLSGTTYVQDYNAVGITYNESSNFLPQSTKSFFRLEFYKTPNNEPPDRTNRRFVFAKNLSLPNGEQYFYTPLNQKIFVPVFMGSNYTKKENMYLFWFQDESSFDETSITGNTFWMTVRFFNANDGSIRNFVNRIMTNTQEVLESRDLYYEVEIDKSDYSYIIHKYTGTTIGDRVGENFSPILFYERGGGSVFIPPTPTSTPTLTATPALTPTITATSGGGGGGDTFTAYYVYSGSTRSDACNNGVLTVLYYIGGAFGGDYEYWTQANVTLANGYYSVNGIYYRIINGAIVVIDSYGACPPAPTPVYFYNNQFYTGTTAYNACDNFSNGLNNTVYYGNLGLNNTLFMDAGVTAVGTGYYLFNNTLYVTNSSGIIISVTTNYHCV